MSRTSSSFHTTISTLEGLWALYTREDEERFGAALDAGAEYFYDHQFCRSSTTGNMVRGSFSKLSFPPRWNSDVLRGLEHSAKRNVQWHERLRDPLNVVIKRRRASDI